MIDLISNILFMFEVTAHVFVAVLNMFLYFCLELVLKEYDSCKVSYKFVTSS